MSPQTIKNYAFLVAVQMFCGVTLAPYLLISGSSGIGTGVVMLLVSVVVLGFSLFVAQRLHDEDIHVSAWGLVGGLVLLGANLLALGFLVSFWIPVGILGILLVYMSIGYLLNKTS